MAARMKTKTRKPPRTKTGRDLIAREHRLQVARLQVLANLGEQIVWLLKTTPEATTAFRELFGPELHPHDIIQTAVTRYYVDTLGEDPP